PANGPARPCHRGVVLGVAVSDRRRVVGPGGVPVVTTPTARLLLSCPDQKGLVARVADFVWKLGGNIVHADQHTDDQAGVFFQRVEFLMDGLSVDRLDLRERFSRLATELHMDWRLTFSDESSRVAIM